MVLTLEKVQFDISPEDIEIVRDLFARLTGLYGREFRNVRELKDNLPKGVYIPAEAIVQIDLDEYSERGIVLKKVPIAARAGKKDYTIGIINFI